MGRSTIGITMDTYSHVVLVLQWEAADVLDSTLASKAPLPVPEVEPLGTVG